MTTTSEALPPEAVSPADRLAPDPTVRFVGAAAGFLVVFWSIYVAFVTTELGQRLENSALQAATLRAETIRAESLNYLSQVSAASFVGAMALIALVGMVRRRPGLGILAVAVMGFSALGAEALKIVLPRPELTVGPGWILRNSFPSGTATVVASVGIGALLVAPDRLRWLVLLTAAAAVGFIGQATQVTGWHRASDALGGVVLAGSVACLGLIALARIHHARPSGVGHIDRRILRLVWIVAVGAIVLGVAIVGLFIAFPLLGAPVDAESVFLHTASDLVVFGLSTIAMATFAWVIDPFTLGASSTAVTRPIIAPAVDEQGEPPPDAESG